MKKLENIEDNKSFVEYATFIGGAASEPLYDYTVREYVQVLAQEDKLWQQVPHLIKEQFPKLPATDWKHFFTQPANPRDLEFVLRCRKWVLSYMDTMKTEKDIQMMWSNQRWLLPFSFLTEKSK